MPVLESLFNNIAGLQACNVIKKRIQHRCFPVHIAKFLITTISKNICERLLLPIFLHINPSSIDFRMSPVRLIFDESSGGIFVCFLSEAHSGLIKLVNRDD